MINVYARLQDIIDIHHPMRFVSGGFIVLKSENKESAIRACSQVRLFQNSKAEFYLLHGGVPQDFKLQVFFVWLNSPMLLQKIYNILMRRLLRLFETIAEL